MKQLFFLASMSALVGCAPAAAEAPFSGIGKAKDGDSLLIGTREVRLFGIDAPEWDQICTRAGRPWACGQDAADQLSRLVTGKQVTCTPVNTDEHGRTVARCTVGVLSVNRALVSSGYATAYRHYSSDYVPAENEAKAGKRGLWSGSFERPSDYRHTQSVDRKPRRRTQSSAAPRGVDGCAIKGNQGSNGWIYHLPRMPFYKRTRAEQMFCSEGEAQAAGYRRAKVR